MINDGGPAFPRPLSELDRSGHGLVNETSGDQTGLTKRELFAAMAMQGYIATVETEPDCDFIAKVSVEMADALIARLKRK